jgi:hypothetical protein
MADKDHAEIDAGRDRRSSADLKARCTQILDASVESRLGEQLIELDIERMTRRLGKLIGGKEKILLFRFPPTQRHARRS